KLGALRDNGGSTKTIAIGRKGAAIDQVPASRAGCPLKDQRGVNRRGGRACDIGAYEVVPPGVRAARVRDIAKYHATVSDAIAANQVFARVYVEFGTSKRYDKKTGVKRVFGVKPMTLAWLLGG